MPNRLYDTTWRFMIRDVIKDKPYQMLLKDIVHEILTHRDRWPHLTKAGKKRHNSTRTWMSFPNARSLSMKLRGDKDFDYIEDRRGRKYAWVGSTPKTCRECNKIWQYNGVDFQHSSFCHECRGIEQ